LLFFQTTYKFLLLLAFWMYKIFEHIIIPLEKCSVRIGTLDFKKLAE
jgi:hypothetical protein